MQDSTKASPDLAADLMIPGRLWTTLTFSILPSRISLQNTRFTGVGPVVKNVTFFVKDEDYFSDFACNSLFPFEYFTG